MRDILHCDLNNFYASCECIKNPKLKDLPVAVGGKQEDRHGVIVASNYEAKKFGVRCGVTVFNAKRLCPNIVICTPNFKLYNEMSQRVRKIYERYTDQVEAFSIDECFLDVTHSKIFGSPKEIADKIREDVKRETGLTISVGVSFNKTFAKIGSDLKKPDATSVITPENFKEIVWQLPIGDMFGVGRKMKEKLLAYNVNTIGDLAHFNKQFLTDQFGKMGTELYEKANGIDDEPVKFVTDKTEIKSVGNSTTFYKDLSDRKEIELAFMVIAENIVYRMIKKGLASAHTLSIVVKDENLKVYQKQCQFPPCRSSKVFAETAIKLFFANYKDMKVRLLGISVTGFDESNQISMFEQTENTNEVDDVVYKIRNKFGRSSLQRGVALNNEKIAHTFDREQLDKEFNDDEQ